MFTNRLKKRKYRVVQVTVNPEQKSHGASVARGGRNLLRACIGRSYRPLSPCSSSTPLNKYATVAAHSPSLSGFIRLAR